LSVQLRSALLAAGVLLAVAFPVHAYLYTYVDQQGTMHFSSTPLDGRYTRWDVDNNRVGSQGEAADVSVAPHGQSHSNPTLTPNINAASQNIVAIPSEQAARADSDQDNRRQPAETGMGITPSTATAVPSRAGFYSYADPQGVVHFSSEKRDSRYIWFDAAVTTAHHPQTAQQVSTGGVRPRRQGIRKELSRHLAAMDASAARPSFRRASKLSHPAHPQIRLAQNLTSSHLGGRARFSRPYAGLVQQAAQKQGISSALVYSVI
jgi:hypothetical protein